MSTSDNSSKYKLLASHSSLLLVATRLEIFELVIIFYGGKHFIVNMKEAPMRYFLSRYISPPQAYTIFLQMLSPSPIPILFMDEEASSLPKSLNSLS